MTNSNVIAGILLVQLLFVLIAMVIVLFKRNRWLHHFSELIHHFSELILCLFKGCPKVSRFLKIQIILKDYPIISRLLQGTPILSWFLSFLLVALEVINGMSNIPAIEAWGFKVEPTSAAFMTFILAAYYQLAAWQVSSKFLWHYRDIEEIQLRSGSTHKLFIPEALTSLRNVAKVISHGIDQGNPNGTKLLKTLRSHHGIYDIDDKSIPDRKIDIHNLLRDLDCITNYFFALDKKPGTREKVIEELFLGIIAKTVKPLMGMTSALVDSIDNPVQFPEHYASIIMNKTLENVQSPNPHGIIPGATSRFSFERFREVYKDSDKPGKKARRVFLLPDAWKETTIEEINAIMTNSSKTDSPTPITPLAKKEFGENNPICHFAWSVDYHDSIGWEVKFMNIAKFDQLWNATSLSALKYKDFLVAPCSADSSTIVFSADMDHEEKGRRYINLPIDMRRVQVFWDDNGETNSFYDKVWAEALEPIPFLEATVLYNGTTPPALYSNLLKYLTSRAAP